MQFSVRTNSTVTFTGALVTGAASAIADVPMPKQLFGPLIIRSVLVLSVQQLAWELDWFSSNTGVNSSPDLDAWSGRWGFSASDGQQIAAAGLYRYLIPELWMPYQDIQNYEIDGPQYLHLMLVNADQNNAKIAGAGGAIAVQVTMERMDMVK